MTLAEGSVLYVRIDSKAGTMQESEQDAMDSMAYLEKIARERYLVAGVFGDMETEAIDGAELRTFLLDGVSAAMDVTGDTFFKVLNGAHTLDITASDGKAEAVHRLTFTKEVTSASITLAQPIEADDRITICVLSVAGSIPADAQYSVKATNNGKDDEPVWEDCTMEVKNGGNHSFANETAAKGFGFSFRVEAARSRREQAKRDDRR